ncbi:uncharacterized protein LOC126800194 [Argentina anserina]|uniref:uncharacterized protein LOC126800194 n=1 Tax=Argentina anserina TaxID=57926 RepID=UPI0021763F41|nr:uncharacterized protein LOC126800194 [Potentilla anserina]
MSSSSRHPFLRQGSWSRRRPVQLKNHVSDCKDRLAEVAGGTAAECAAVCCCCPCGLVNLLVLVIYKVPAGLCRRVLRKKRRQRLIKKGLLQPSHLHCTCDCDGRELQFHPLGRFESLSSEFKAVQKLMMEDDESSDPDVIELEKEMWDRFYGTGFWRSPTQRETPSISNSNSNSNSSSDSKVVVSGT